MHFLTTAITFVTLFFTCYVQTEAYSTFTSSSLHSDHPFKDSSFIVKEIDYHQLKSGSSTSNSFNSHLIPNSKGKNRNVVRYSRDTSCTSYRGEEEKSNLEFIFIISHKDILLHTKSSFTSFTLYMDAPCAKTGSCPFDLLKAKCDIVCSDNIESTLFECKYGFCPFISPITCTSYLMVHCSSLKLVSPLCYPQTNVWIKSNDEKSSNKKTVLKIKTLWRTLEEVTNYSL